MRKAPSWDVYFMEVARVIASRSKDPKTQVGAVLVDRNNHIVGTGYNGFPPGALESKELWRRPVKYEHVIHAEENALLHATTLIFFPFRNYTLYTTMYPCPDCARFICEKSITRIVYDNDKYITPEAEAWFNHYGIKVERLEKQA